MICDGNLLANSNKTFSTKMGKFSMAVLQPFVITLTGLFSLCVLTLPYIFPAVELKGVIKYFHLLSKMFLLCNFYIQLLTLISNCLLGSYGSCLNELLSIWYLTFCSYSLFSKITILQHLSCILIIWSFHDFISFNAFCFLFQMFGRVKTNDVGLNKSFSIL